MMPNHWCQSTIVSNISGNYALTPIILLITSALLGSDIL